MKIRLTLLALLCSMSVMAQRKEVNLSTWNFSRDGKTWEKVTIPHDWAIAGPFDKKWDLQTVAIVQNGETEATEKSGRSGALPWIGEGWYKCTVRVPREFSRAEIVFDGAMAEPDVKVNGKAVGGWKYGYNAFRLDITKELKKDMKNSLQGRKNTRDKVNYFPADVEVHLKNVEESSRWYPGAGLYRPVKIVLTGSDKHQVSLDEWATFIRVTSLTDNKAVINVDTKAIGYKPGDNVKLLVNLLDTNGEPIKYEKATINPDGTCTAQLTIEAPKDVDKLHPWTPETPYLYRLQTMLYEELGQSGDDTNINIFDRLTNRIGLRTVKVSAEGGFQLNGISRKIKGVCLHHDLGPLGAAVNKDAIIRQIRILKDMGCDAIRTSHNMPSTMQMEVCDSMGMMVMAESFDMWIYPKCKNGYARFFKEWADKDITNLVLNHRNHPSIVMWSIGNEIPEQWSQEGVEISRHLQDIIHKLDPTRPVTQGMDRAADALKSGFAQVMDIPGFNYRAWRYDQNIKELPKGFLLGSETASTVSSRGVYKFPVELKYDFMYPDGQCSSYDTEFCSWSNLPEDDFLMMDDRPWTIGQFVWTGFDYLGEPWPYDGYWPSRSSYFGICDLAGLPKDRYYLYRSQWNTNDHTLHILPHWTWPGREGQVTPVFVYTDYPEAELFVNGKSQGRIKKDPTANQVIYNPEAKGQNDELLNRYRLRWNNVVYQPGELKVVAYDSNGRKAAEKTVKTAGTPTTLELTSDREWLPAKADALAFITVSLTDGATLIPDADDQLTFSVSGAGTFRGVCNGDATSLEPFTEPQMKLFNGQLVVVVQASKMPGNLTLTVKDARRGLEKSITLPVK